MRSFPRQAWGSRLGMVRYDFHGFPVVVGDYLGDRLITSVRSLRQVPVTSDVQKHSKTYDGRNPIQIPLNKCP